MRLIVNVATNWMLLRAGSNSYILIRAATRSIVSMHMYQEAVQSLQAWANYIWSGHKFHLTYPCSCRTKITETFRWLLFFGPASPCFSFSAASK